MSKRKICIVTGTRADYGLLYWLLREIQEDPDLTLQLAVTGMHLAPEFGETYRAIEDDGFEIHAEIEMLLSSDTPVGTAKAIGLGVIGFAEALARLRPDVLVLLGDRFEMLAAAQAALVAQIPMAHIHGGETTEGAFDEGIRHSLTKMAHLHFVAAEPYRRRVIQLGEVPERVFNVGAPGLDHLRRLDLLGREAFEESTAFELGELNFLVTYHPVTLAGARAEASVQALLDALDHFPEAKVLFTKTNADPQGRLINQTIEAYAERQPGRAKVYASLGQQRYLSALRHVEVVIGNSSSGLLEAPAFQVPTVNVGARQRGRLKASSVIDCAEREEEIVEAIREVLSPAFQAGLEETQSPYGEGNASVRIKEHLKKAALGDTLLMKTFNDLDT